MAAGEAPPDDVRNDEAAYYAWLESDDDNDNDNDADDDGAYSYGDWTEGRAYAADVRVW